MIKLDCLLLFGNILDFKQNNYEGYDDLLDR